MNNDLKLYFPTNFCDNKVTGDVMWNALSSIAKEIQRFRQESGPGKQTIYKNYEDTLVKKNTDAVELDTNKKRVKILKKHLKTVWKLAKIVLSSKNKETELLLNRLTNAENESSLLWKSNAENLSLIQKLRMENYNINSDIQFFCNFTHMAYKKLQEMRNEIPKDIPFIEELKTILLACGQYYADYCNSQDQCAQLERRNRFLKNKLNIVENNLAATTEELRNLKSINMKLRLKCEQCELNRKNEARLRKFNGPNARVTIPNIILGDDKKYCYNAAVQKTVECERNVHSSNKGLYITSHLETVRNLLLEQDHMLEELKKLYLEVRTSES